MQTSKQSQSLLRKIGIAFAVSLAVCIGLSLSLAMIAAPMGILALTLSGAADGIPSIFAEILVRVMLPIAMLCAVGIGTVSSIMLWIFHRSTPAQPEPTLAQLARCDFEEIPRKLTRRAFVPDVGSLLVLLGIGAAFVYFERPPIAYQYWQNLQHLPWLVCACAVAGAIMIAYRGHAIRDRLPSAWWRLRAILIVLAAIVAFNSVAAWHRESAQCTQPVLEALLDTGNINDLKTYANNNCDSEVLGKILAKITSELIGHTTYSEPKHYESSRWRDLLHVLSILGVANFYNPESESAPSSRTTPVKLDRTTLLSALSTVLNAGARVGRLDWEVLMMPDADQVRDEILAVYRSAPDSSGAWSVDSLRELVNDLAARGKTDQLRYLVKQGMHFDASWHESSFLLIDTALYKKSPNWDFYDELVVAGLPVPAKLQQLLTAIRSRELSGISGWSVDDWQSPASGLARNGYTYNYSLQFAVVLYTEDAVLRAQILRLSGIDEQTLIDQTPLPKRCILAKRFGAERIRSSFPKPPNESYEVERCENVFWTVTHERD